MICLTVSTICNSVNSQHQCDVTSSGMYMRAMCPHDRANKLSTDTAGPASFNGNAIVRKYTARLSANV